MVVPKPDAKPTEVHGHVLSRFQEVWSAITPQDCDWISFIQSILATIQCSSKPQAKLFTLIKPFLTIKYLITKPQNPCVTLSYCVIFVHVGFQNWPFWRRWFQMLYKGTATDLKIVNTSMAIWVESSLATFLIAANKRKCFSLKKLWSKLTQMKKNTQRHSLFRTC